MNAPPPAPVPTVADHVQRPSDVAAAGSRLRRIAYRALLLGAGTGLGIRLSVGFVLGCRPVLRVTTLLVAGPVLLVGAAPTAIRELRLYPRRTPETQPHPAVPERAGQETW